MQTMTEYQADQLRRLEEYCHRFGRPMPVVARKGAPRSDLPSVWRQLEDLGLVTVTLGESTISVSPAVVGND